MEKTRVTNHAEVTRSGRVSDLARRSAPVMKNLPLYGSTARMGISTAAVLLLAVLCVATAPLQLRASVEQVDEGIKFTYYDPDAGQVHLAGTFNNWSSSATPMTKDESGNWTAVLQLSSGKHEYKFVVDGAWITDMDNPNTKPDPYGGINSIVEIDAGGAIVETAAAHPLSNTKLSSRVFIGGRYLSRTRIEKDVRSVAADGSKELDPRWRAQRPVQNVDFNFRITISDMVLGYTRLRIDTDKNVLQPNNISLFLDEAHIELKPAAFTLTGYYNEELLSSADPLAFFGDIDLAGTIRDDHLPFGKGTAGVTASSNQLGIDISGFVANVHDFDYYNDERLYDNTGTDLMHARAAKTCRTATAGANLFLERNLWWLDFTGLVGETPANTGIGRLDEHIDRTGDNSDWFEFDDRLYLYGPDLTLHLVDDKLLPQIELLWGKYKQGFVTGNNSGLNEENGPIDVPIFERDLRIAHGSLQYTGVDNLHISAEHTRIELTHPNEDEGFLVPIFDYDENANKHIFFSIDSGPRTFTIDYSELVLDWHMNRFGATLWLQRWLNRRRPPSTGDESWYYVLSASPVLRYKPSGRIELELEQQYLKFEGTPSIYCEMTTFETIARGTLGITGRLSAIFDIRNIYVRNDTGSESRNFTAPFAGLQYNPAKKVSLVLAFGLDPIDYDIDYSGRQTGRYNFRQEYIWALPDDQKREYYGSLHPVVPYYLSQQWDPVLSLPVVKAGGTLDGNPVVGAEEALESSKMITLRVIYNF